jgi:hypothetical protein
MSTIKATTLSTQSNATVPIDTVVNGTAKAWVNFNGTGTVAIRASFNVASITDHGTGDYSISFTNAMPDANYAMGGMVQDGDASVNNCNISIQYTASGGLQTSNVRIRTCYDLGNIYDFPFVTASVFR